MLMLRIALILFSYLKNGQRVLWIRQASLFIEVKGCSAVKARTKREAIAELTETVAWIDDGRPVFSIVIRVATRMKPTR